MKRYCLLLLSLVCLFCAHTMAQVRILTIGDSTMADYDEVKNSEEKEKRGWAQMLPYFLTDDVQVDNAARNGRSSKSFYFEFWEKLKETIKPGDYVVIQFGHNDEKNNGQDTDESDPKERGTAPWSQYRKYLKIYINDVRERGATPVLATPVVRRMFNEDGITLSERGKHNLIEYSDVKNDSVMNYVLAMKAVAREMNVPLVDMTALTEELVTKYGPGKSKELIYCQEDNTHLKALGGLMFARLFVNDLEKKGILKNDIRLSQALAITPKEIDFGTQLTAIPSVKAISICGMDLPGRSNVRLEVGVPFGISLHPDKDYKNELQITSEAKDLYKAVYIRFTPKDAISYNQQLTITVNDKRQNVELRGSGIAVNKNKIVEAKISPVMGEKEPKTKGKISASFSLSDLEYKNRVFAPENEWVKDEIDLSSSRYIELAVTVKEDTYIHHLSFTLKAIGTDYMYYTALGSFDPAFSKVDSYAVMENVSSKKEKTLSFDKMIKLPKGKTYILRIYPWDKTGGKDKYLVLDNITIKGVEAK